jgi:peptide deformylase
MRYIIFLLLGGVMLTACSSLQTNTKLENAFSKDEIQLITSGIATQPMRVLQINIPQDSLILRSKSKPFNVNPKDKILKLLTNRMLVTMQKKRGVGIAAPQVGVLKQIIWVQRLDKENEPFEVYYNPVIQQYSLLKQDVPEGCLSVPDFRGVTQDRSYAVFLTYQDKDGADKCEMVEAFTAAIFQHEIDHLNGIMFTDHLLKEQEKSIEHELD